MNAQFTSYFVDGFSRRYRNRHSSVQSPPIIFEIVCDHYHCTATMASENLLAPTSTFASFSHLLDARLLRALADMGFARPTLVQAKAIPLAFESHDILARARTGSGKTAAYSIPVVQKILSVKSVGAFAALGSECAVLIISVLDLGRGGSK